MAAPRFQIYAEIQYYDDRDAVCAVSFRPEPMAYITEALAHRICDRMNEHDFEHGGDGCFGVRDMETGARVYRKWSAEDDAALMSDMPW